MNLRNILLVAVLMGLLYAFNRWLQPPPGNAFSVQPFRLSPGQVDALLMESQALGGELTLAKTPQGWMVSDGRRSVAVQAAVAEAMIGSVGAMRTVRIAAHRAEQWPTYHLDAERATRVQLLAKGRVVADFHLGAYETEATDEEGPLAHVRLGRQTEVFAVRGLTPQWFTRPIGQYRSTQVVDLRESAPLTAFALEVADTLLFSFEKRGPHWLLNGADTLPAVVVEAYLAGLANLRADAFADDFDEVQQAHHRQQVLRLPATSTAQGGLTVVCYHDTLRQPPYVVWSSQQPGAWFASDTSGLYGLLFGPWAHLWAVRE